MADAPTGNHVDVPTGPLAGAKVLELAQVVAGPTGGYMLADLGAEVIKIERVPGGDDARRLTPPDIDGESAAFLMLNRNKRGIARNMMPEITHARLGQVRTLGSPIKFSETPTNLRSGAPVLGQHTAEIMRGLGYSDGDIDRMARDGAVIVA
jgi:crotonobetainyl-CoA:carnitine CoA-transferase CaiB-like acyl-CoA transferase